MEGMFDLEDYVRKRLAEIEDIEERRFAKELLLKGLLPIFELTEQRYLQLEHQIKKEIEVSREKYNVYMTIINKSDYDPINGTLFPVCTDMLKQPMETSYTIYFSGSYEKKKVFEHTGKWNARDRDGKRHTVGMRKARCYQDAVLELYEVFVYNKIRWTTVNTGYLDRFYELYPLEEEGDIREWDIDFGTMGEYVMEDMLPVWNIEKFTFQCRKFMVPCIDEKYYEHELDLSNYDPDSGYMLGINEEVHSIRYEKEKIIMVSEKESFRNWMAYRFTGNIDMSSHGYHHEILGNRREKNFAQSLIERQELPFISRTELFRMVQSFGYGEYVELYDSRIVSEEDENYMQADMNPFLGGWVFPMETRKRLLLRFHRKHKESVFCEDMVRFVVSQMQLSLCEYKCVGILD